MGDPTFMYRNVNGEIETEVFDSDQIPEGWYDSPEAADPQAHEWAENIDREVLEKMYENEFGKKPHYRMKDDSIIKALEDER